MSSSAAAIILGFLFGAWFTHSEAPVKPPVQTPPAISVTVSDLPLQRAAAIGDVETIKSLLKSGVAVDAMDSQNMTALYVAASNHQKESVLALLDSGAKLDTLNEDGNIDAVTAAVRENDREILILLKEHGANVTEKKMCSNVSLLYLAVLSGSNDVIPTLLSYGSDIHERSHLLGIPLLTFAVMRGNVETAKLLLDKGIDPNNRDIDDNVAIQYAVVSKNIPMISLLLKYGADINIKNNAGISPSEMATFNNDPEVLKAMGLK